MKPLFKNYLLFAIAGLLSLSLSAQHLPSGVNGEDASCISFIPAAISPNGDGINDAFSVQCECLPEHFSIRVFDTQNKVVFQSKDFRATWDGRFQGDPQPEGIYTYELAYRDPQGAGLVRQQGEVTLIR